MLDSIQSKDVIARGYDLVGLELGGGHGHVQRLGRVGAG